MQLNIVKPSQKSNYNVTWIDIQTPVGNYVIEKNHAPMIIALSNNSKVTYLLDNKKVESIHVTRGIIHITRESAILLIND